MGFKRKFDPNPQQHDSGDIGTIEIHNDQINDTTVVMLLLIPGEYILQKV